MQHDPTDVRIAVARERPAPGLDCVDRLDTAGEAEILDRLHDRTRVFIKAAGIFIQANYVGRVLCELDIARRGDAHSLFRIGSHLVGMDIDRA